ncbi:Cation efflux system protein CusA [Chlamydiales bacterium SCGC AG-110-M15]|nr:Cation efflux system protein CusA [Chlamydiales bacterium SCGC AG-110-M15]
MSEEPELEVKNSFDNLLKFCLKNKLIVLLLLGMITIWGAFVAPFDWNFGSYSRDPVPVDAIPDIGENQQIIFTKWAGVSPQDIEDQVTYPLSSSLLALPGVKTIRAYSMFGFSSIYIIFDEDVDFYWSRSRILEKLNSLPAGTLPKGVKPSLGPDATALGQIFWYTLEGQDNEGNPTGGWDLDELRSVQDWTVRYALLSASGVSEVASVGGFTKEYQVDVDPDAMKAYGVKLHEVMAAVKSSNMDVGARTMEVNKVEYVIRGIGLLKSIEDLERAVIKVVDGVPVFLKSVAQVHLGPSLRRGALNKEGSEAVGGVAVVRYGYNPLQAIKNVKQKIEEISVSLPEKTLADGTVSKVRIVPFYDRTELIYETLDTLNSAVFLEILVTVIVILVMLQHFGSSFIISLTLPLAVLLCFIFMKIFHVDANIVSLSGIAIAIGTMVAAGILVCENILKKMTQNADGEVPKLTIVYSATREVSGAVLTAVATTVVSFLPVFTMVAAEGKLFKPLAFTKTFALLASVLIAFTIVPVISYYFLKPRNEQNKKLNSLSDWGIVGFMTILLIVYWMPLGLEKGLIQNSIFIVLTLAAILAGFQLFQKSYSRMLRWTLRNKKRFLALPGSLLLIGILIWSGLGKEFMPPLDEGAFLYMPTTMPHASITESLDVLGKQNKQIQSIPEIKTTVGKLGRVESPLDPAPISMIETIIQYKSQYLRDKSGKILHFAYHSDEEDFVRGVDGKEVLANDGKPYKTMGRFARDEQGNLIEDSSGAPFRLWRPPLLAEYNPGRMPWEGIKNPNDIWKEISRAGTIPGTTSAPMLQPIIARIVMLQSGMRAPMGIKIKGPTLEAIEYAGLQLEKSLKGVDSIEPETVTADRIIAKPYLEIRVDRESIARYGIKLHDIQTMIQVAIGGRQLTTTVEGRERYPVRVRYMRELRDQIESIGEILIPSPTGAQIPLGQLANVEYVAGPQVIKSEDGFLVGYLTFDKKPEFAEVDVVQQAQQSIQEKLDSGELDLGDNVSYIFAGNFQNQLRAEKKLAIVVPLTLAIIFILLYLQFKSSLTTLMVFSGILVAWSGGFIMIWLYGQTWFCNFSIFGTNLRELFQMHPINLSVAIWVGFLALFGIASDIGVIIASAIDQAFEGKKLESIDEVQETVVKGAENRIRPALMTSATTLLALLPVLTSSGRGADIMIPMAIPSFGGMFVALISVFVVPVFYSWRKERELKKL